jgi:hypothetical protein
MAETLISKQNLIDSGFHLNKKFVMIDSTKYQPDAFEYILQLADNCGSIIFVSDSKKIWAKGKYFGGDIFQADLLYFTEFAAIDGDGNASSTSAHHPKSKLTFKTNGHLNATAIYKEDTGENEINFDYDLDGAVNNEEFQIDAKSFYSLNVVDGQIKMNKYTPISISLRNLNLLEYDSGEKMLNIAVTISGGNGVMNYDVTATTALPEGEQPQIIVEEATSTQNIVAIIPENVDVLFTANVSDSRMRATGTTVQQWGYACYYGSNINPELIVKDDILASGFDKYIILDNPNKSVIIEQNGEEYGYFICPAQYPVEFVDESTNLTGGWIKIGTFENYSFNELYNIYRTEHAGLGYMKWKIVKK